jgi:hypothetical protein
MTRATPLAPEEFDDLPNMMASFPVADLPSETHKDYWFGCRIDEPTASGIRLSFQPDEGDDPIFQIHSTLRDRLSGRFDLVRAVSFANVGTRVQ